MPRLNLEEVYTHMCLLCGTTWFHDSGLRSFDKRTISDSRESIWFSCLQFKRIQGDDKVSWMDILQSNASLFALVPRWNSCCSLQTLCFAKTRVQKLVFYSSCSCHQCCQAATNEPSVHSAFPQFVAILKPNARTLCIYLTDIHWQDPRTPGSSPLKITWV